LSQPEHFGPLRSQGSKELRDGDAKWDARHQFREAVSIALSDNGFRGAKLIEQLLSDIAERLWGEGDDLRLGETHPSSDDGD
jgi:hypothetical protein